MKGYLNRECLNKYWKMKILSENETNFVGDVNWSQIEVLCLGVIIIFFNVLLICVILKSKTFRKQRLNKIMISLAMTDFSVGVLIQFSSLRMGSWPFGASICTLVTSLEVILSCASIYHFLAVNIDRLGANACRSTLVLHVTDLC